MQWECKRFADLSPEELYRLLQLRVDVFVVEQQCPYPELDGKDPACLHLYYRDEDGIQAYLRVVPAGVSYAEASIGRVVSRKRRCGLATSLLHEGIRMAREVFGAQDIRIRAQIYARRLYEGVGFWQVSEEYLEDGITHIEMLLESTEV